MINLGVYHVGDGFNTEEKIFSSLATAIARLEET